MVNSSQALVSDNEWFTLEIIVRGKHILTTVNGQSVADYTEPADVDRVLRPERGTFALQAHDLNGAVRYRKVEVRPLP